MLIVNTKSGLNINGDLNMSILSDDSSKESLFDTFGVKLEKDMHYSFSPVSSDDVNENIEHLDEVSGKQSIKTSGFRFEHVHFLIEELKQNDMKKDGANFVQKDKKKQSYMEIIPTYFIPHGHITETSTAVFREVDDLKSIVNKLLEHPSYINTSTICKIIIDEFVRVDGVKVEEMFSFMDGIRENIYDYVMKCKSTPVALGTLAALFPQSLSKKYNPELLKKYKSKYDDLGDHLIATESFNGSSLLNYAHIVENIDLRKYIKAMAELDEDNNITHSLPVFRMRIAIPVSIEDFNYTIDCMSENKSDSDRHDIGNNILSMLNILNSNEVHIYRENAPKKVYKSNVKFSYDKTTGKLDFEIGE